MSKGKKSTISPTNATIRSKHHLKKNPILYLFFSTLHGLHVENCLNTLQRYDFSKWVQHFDCQLHPPTIMNLQLAIGFAKVEILDEKVLNVRVLSNGTGTISYITVLFFAQIILVHLVEKSIIRISVVVFVFG